jgi:hypothetical protein
MLEGGGRRRKHQIVMMQIGEYPYTVIKCVVLLFITVCSALIFIYSRYKFNRPTIQIPYFFVKSHRFHDELYYYIT